MATRVFATLADGQCRFLVDYNANNGRVRALICENAAPLPAYGEVHNPNDGAVYGQEFPAGQTTERVVPAGVMTVRLTEDAEIPGYFFLEVRIDATGVWVNLETQMRYPA
jgi:hypothetical protein